VPSAKGALPIALRTQAEDKIGLLVPRDNAAEAAVVKGFQVIPIQNLTVRTFGPSKRSPSQQIRLQNLNIGVPRSRVAIFLAKGLPPRHTTRTRTGVHHYGQQ